MSFATTLPAPKPALPTPQNRVVLVALAIIAALAWAIQQSASSRTALLFATGIALGVVLYRSLFGFTSAFRVLLADGRSAGFRAQMVMLGVACLLFFPAFAGGSLFGQPVTGFVSPVGVSVAVDAFLFGMGMQLGGGCASGTLFSVGGGSTAATTRLGDVLADSFASKAALRRWLATVGARPAVRRGMNVPADR